MRRISNNSTMKRIIAFMLIFTIIFGTFPSLQLNAQAAITDVNYNKKVDPSTMDDWKKFFGSSSGTTENAGGIWVDKSVFSDTSKFNNLSKDISLEDSDNFLVAMSAIASNKTIVGYSHIPTDTMIVLDVSSSMSEDYDELIDAANSAINKLRKLNNNNRVGVVLYSGTDNSFNVGNDRLGYEGTSQLILPLDEYNANTDGNYLTDSSSLRRDRGIAVANGVTDSDGNRVSQSYKELGTGTYIQDGVYDAMLEFLRNDTIIPSGMQQAGTTRLPIMILMSDGEPTLGTQYFDGQESTSSIGRAAITMNNASNNVLGFINQLTSAYAKNMIDEHYKETSPLFYTLGVGVENNTSALEVLNPDIGNSTINNYWNSYNANKSVSLSGNNTRWTVTANDAVTIDDRFYVDQYFSANSARNIDAAFNDIVEEIIFQSLYQPTLVENNNSNLDGYIEFIDDVGQYMEVKEIEGIVVGDKIFTGEELSKGFNTNQSILGTIENPTDLGNNMIWAVIERLGIDKVTDSNGNKRFPTYASQVAEAITLVDMAYNHGQLRYDSSTGEFSNYIGWYADKNGNYLGFWDESHSVSQLSDSAYYVNKSYGMLGEVSDGINASNMMYISIQVRSKIDKEKTADVSNNFHRIYTSKQQVIWKIPSSLIPVITYEISVDNISSLDDIDDNTPISVSVKDKEPIRLLFEVGLNEDINPITITDIVDEEYLKKNTKDDKYYFYTNDWDTTTFNNDEYAQSEAVNTIAFFEPSLENERYYYNEDTKIYTAKDSDSEYKGDEKPSSGTYYRMYHVFKKNLLGNYIWSVNYETISQEALSKASKSGEYWYIPKGTIHRALDDYYTSKTSNVTETLKYSNFPSIEKSGDSFYADAILGNNGRIEIPKVTGMSLTKITDGTITDNNKEYIFEITADSSVDGAYTAFKGTVDSLGNEEVNYEDSESITFVEGEASVSLKQYEKIYIIGLPEKSYEINEVIEEEDSYKVKKIVLDGKERKDIDIVNVNIEKNTISDVIFENTFDGEGLLTISKEVTHDLGSAFTPDNQKTFPITVKLGTESTATLPLSVDINSTLDNKVRTVDVENGQFEYNIRHGETISVVFDTVSTGNIDATVIETLTEEEKKYFASKVIYDNDDSLRKTTISSGENGSVKIENKYEPEEAVPTDIIIKGKKNLEGRQWLDTDVFTFALDYYDYNTDKWIECSDKVDVLSITQDYEFDLTNDLMKNARYNELKTYHYRIREVKDEDSSVPGVDYDTRMYLFNVDIADDNMTGKLKVDKVYSVNTPEIVTGNAADGWNIEVIFTNKYQVSGNASLYLNIIKTMVNKVEGAQYVPEGFEFELYKIGVIDNSVEKVGENLEEQTQEETQEETQEQETQKQELTQKEVQKQKVIQKETHEVASIQEGIQLEEPIQIMEPQDPIQIQKNESTLLLSTEEPLNQQETLATITETEVPKNSGVSILSSVVEEEPSANNKIGDSIKTAIDGTASFDNLRYTSDDIGKTYIYIIKEVDSNIKGITYAKEQKIYVTVYDKLDGTIGVKAYKENESIPTDETKEINLEFENVYEPNSAKVNIEASKSLQGRDLNKEFIFQIIDKERNVVAEATNDKDGKIKFKELIFDKQGEYRYTISEKKNDIEGIIYDETVYEINVIVTDNDKTDGSLEAQVLYNGGDITSRTQEVIKFNNTYVAYPTDIALEGNKNLSGRELIEEEFIFNLYEADENFNIIGNAIDTAKNDEEGAFEFDKITKTQDDVGTYYYIVTEENNALPDITYDQSQYLITVEVKDNGKGYMENNIISINKRGENGSYDSIVFNNGYAPLMVIDDVVDEPQVKDVSVNIVVNKTVENVGTNILLPSDFEFVLQQENTDIKLSKKTDYGGIAEFELTYSTDDIGKKYKYILYEVNDARENVTYDTKIYTIEVDISLDSQNNILVPTLYKDGVRTDEIYAEFINIYDKSSLGQEEINESDIIDEPAPNDESEDDIISDNIEKEDSEAQNILSEGGLDDTPRTGDNYNMTLWISILFISGVTICGVVCIKKCRKNNK